MANNIAFQAKGKTTRISLSTSANTVSVFADSPCNQLRIHNGTANEVFVQLSQTSGNAAVIPSNGVPSYGLVLHNNITQIFTAPGYVDNNAPVFVSGIVASGTGILYVTPGEGL